MRHALHTTIVLAALGAACGSGPDAVGPTDSPAAITAPPSLVGPTWRLVSIDGHDALPGVRVTAEFTADDRIAGSAGCNRYVGRAAAQGERLDVGLLASTRMYCGAAGVMEQESAYVAALEQVKAYRLAGTQLQLGPAPGRATVVFELE